MFFIRSLRSLDQLIRILDVASGTYLHDIHINHKKFDWIKNIRVNSNYVVIIGEICLYVCSLQALKNPLPSDACLFEIKHNCKELRSVLIDDTQIICLSEVDFRYHITVFDFGSVDLTPIPTLTAP
jgi:hypothetical protein